jgi:sulfur transfer complex TusBCD TusB component (DsrH family)
MAKKILALVETAYRGTLEEQDDTVLWLTHMLQNAGLDQTVVLAGNAVNYAVRGQDASGLRFGDTALENPPRIDHDLEQLMDKGVPVYFVSEDASERGIGADRLIDGVKPIARRELPSLLGGYDQVWSW